MSAIGAGHGGVAALLALLVLFVLRRRRRLVDAGAFFVLLLGLSACSEQAATARHELSLAEARPQAEPTLRRDPLARLGTPVETAGSGVAAERAGTDLECAPYDPEMVLGAPDAVEASPVVPTLDPEVARPNLPRNLAP